MKRVTQKRRLKKSIREVLQVILVGTIGAALLVGLWIGSVIQTSERLNEMSAEVYQGLPTKKNTDSRSSARTSGWQRPKERKKEKH